MRKWTIGILAILLCAGFSGCAASEEVPPEAGGPITDLAGEVLDLSGSFYYGQYGEVYGRVTSGFYTDNRTEPAAFTAGGDYVGDWKLSDVAVKKYKADAAIGSFRLSSGGTFSLQEASTERGTASPVYQAVRLDDVRLTGVLRLVETTSNTGNFYAENEFAGDLFFYPYPDSLGEIPFIDCDPLGYYPKTAAGERTDFAFAADTLRIDLGNFDRGTVQVAEGAPEDLHSLFAESDFVEAAIEFQYFQMNYTYDAPIEYSCIIGSVEKNGDL